MSFVHRAILHSNMGVGVGTDSIFGIVEKVDKAIQTEKVEVFPSDSSTSKVNREPKLCACCFCGSLEHKRKRFPLNGPWTGCFICNDRGHYAKDCPRCREKYPPRWLARVIDMCEASSLSSRVPTRVRNTDPVKP